MKHCILFYGKGQNLLKMPPYIKMSKTINYANLALVVQSKEIRGGVVVEVQLLTSSSWL